MSRLRHQVTLDKHALAEPDKHCWKVSPATTHGTAAQGQAPHACLAHKCTNTCVDAIERVDGGCELLPSKLRPTPRAYVQPLGRNGLSMAAFAAVRSFVPFLRPSTAR